MRFISLHIHGNSLGTHLIKVLRVDGALWDIVCVKR